MKTGCLYLLIILFSAGMANAQPTNISGIVNTYHKVIEVIPAKACVRVNSTTGLNLGNMVILIQMKGAAINTTASSPAFGDTATLNSAGNYEVGTICYIIGDSVFLYHNLVNTYDAAASVQLVRFAEYYAANVIDTVKAARWDSAAGTGGVIAIYAEDELILNAPVYADASGFKGGNYLLSNSTCSNALPATNYAYNASFLSPQNGAFKGEGVAVLSTSQTGGRGAPANGGGGGNNHNNSGGGGSNLSSGGIGGGNSSSLGCTTTLRGLGGKALSNWGGKKIFAGGGGGAGHSNNGIAPVHGGNGGGIVFVWTNNLTGNNHTISARGDKGSDSQSDGAGGGGAGGTVILHITNYTNNVVIAASGGNGGNSADGGTIGRCYGGGGGGSGGVIYFSGAVPPITAFITGGTAGLETGRDGSCAAEQAAGAGSVGLLFSNYTFTKSTHPAAYCSFLLPVKLLYFEAKKINKSVTLTWETGQPEMARYFIIEKRTVAGDWNELHRIISNPGKHKYGFEDQHPFSGNNFYRIKTEDTNGLLHYSPVKKVWFGPDKNSFTIYPNPSSGYVIIKAAFETGQCVQVRDVTGRIILQKNITGNSTWLQLPVLPPGIYSIRYKDETKKLIIQR